MHFNHFDVKSGGSYSWNNKEKSGKTLCKPLPLELILKLAHLNSTKNQNESQ
jgi:hypothetical protein